MAIWCNFYNRGSSLEPVDSRTDRLYGLVDLVPIDRLAYSSGPSSGPANGATYDQAKNPGHFWASYFCTLFQHQASLHYIATRAAEVTPIQAACF